MLNIQTVQSERKHFLSYLFSKIKKSLRRGGNLVKSIHSSDNRTPITSINQK